MKRVLLAVAVLILGASFAKADSGDSYVYSYTGNTMNNSGLGSLLDPDAATCQCNITGELTFAQPLDLPTDIETVTGTPTSFSFSVDGYTLTQANSTIQQFDLGELWWGLQITGTNGLTISTTCDDGCGDSGGALDWAGFDGNATIGSEVGNRGTWTASVPEPQTIPMLAFSLLLLLGTTCHCKHCCRWRGNIRNTRSS